MEETADEIECTALTGSILLKLYEESQRTDRKRCFGRFLRPSRTTQKIAKNLAELAEGQSLTL